MLPPKQGYLLVQNAHSNAYGLVPKKLIEVHEHEFGNLRDMDDFGGSQDSIMAGLDVSAFAYPEELAKNDKADANGVFHSRTCPERWGLVGNLPDGRLTLPFAFSLQDTYDSPNAVALKSEGEENGGGYAEPRPANQRRPLDLT